MNKLQKQAFDHDMQVLWATTKAAIAPEYHPRLRKVFLKMIRQDEKEYREFVELMETSKDDLANKKLQEAGYDMADELKNIEDGVATHQCHYCGDMYHISDLSGAKEGLICYKCRHEMENRE